MKGKTKENEDEEEEEEEDKQEENQDLEERAFGGKRGETSKFKEDGLLLPIFKSQETKEQKPKPNENPKRKVKQKPFCMLKHNPLFFGKFLLFCDVHPILCKSCAPPKTLQKLCFQQNTAFVDHR